MRTRLVAATLIIATATVLAACGGGGDGSDSSASDSGGATDATEPAPSGSGSDTGSGDGEVDCAAVTEAAKQMLSIQLLAQLRTPETVERIQSNAVGSLDIDEFVAGMEALHQLDGYTNVLGDPEEAIDIYLDAATQAKALFEADPPTQEAIDAYQEAIGGPGEFLSHQTAIAGAIDEAGC